jgi:hypothetical protein
MISVKRQKVKLVTQILNMNTVKLQQAKEIPHYKPTKTMKAWMFSEF